MEEGEEVSKTTADDSTSIVLEASGRKQGPVECEECRSKCPVHSPWGGGEAEGWNGSYFGGKYLYTGNLCCCWLGWVGVLFSSLLGRQFAGRRERKYVEWIGKSRRQHRAER